MKVFDENDCEMAAGQTGEIVMKGPSIMKGYWNQPEETAQTMKNDGYTREILGTRTWTAIFHITDRKRT